MVQKQIVEPRPPITTYVPTKVQKQITIQRPNIQKLIQ